MLQNAGIPNAAVSLLEKKKYSSTFKVKFYSQQVVLTNQVLGPIRKSCISSRESPQLSDSLLCSWKSSVKDNYKCRETKVLLLLFAHSTLAVPPPPVLRFCEGLGKVAGPLGYALRSGTGTERRGGRRKHNSPMPRTTEGLLREGGGGAGPRGAMWIPEERTSGGLMTGGEAGLAVERLEDFQVPFLGPDCQSNRPG